MAHPIRSTLKADASILGREQERITGRCRDTEIVYLIKTMLLRGVILKRLALTIYTRVPIPPNYAALTFCGMGRRPYDVDVPDAVALPWRSSEVTQRNFR